MVRQVRSSILRDECRREREGGKEGEPSTQLQKQLEALEIQMADSCESAGSDFRILNRIFWTCVIV